MPLNNYYQTLTVMGTVTDLDLDALSFSVRARSGDVFKAFVGDTTSYTVLSNLDRLDRDRVPNPQDLRREDGAPKFDLKKYIQKERPVTVKRPARSRPIRRPGTRNRSSGASPRRRRRILAWVSWKLTRRRGLRPRRSSTPIG